MSAHFVKQRIQRNPKDIFPPISPAKVSHSTHTPAKHLDRPHAYGFEQSATAGEMFVMILAMAIMISLVIWLAWILVGGCMSYLKKRLDDTSPNAQAKRVEKRAGSIARLLYDLGVDTTRGIRSSIFGEFNDRDEERGGRSEHSGLLRGYESRIPVYGYRDGRYGDGTSESETSGRTNPMHRDDCEGQCGQPRRRSGD